MMAGNEPMGGFEEVQDGKLRERLDFSLWILNHMDRMTDVQAEGNVQKYENMLTTLIIRLTPWWPTEKNGDDTTFKDRFEKARKMNHNDPRNKIHKQRRELKEQLLAELLDATGIAFTRRKKAKISGGAKRLWEEFPPFKNLQPNNEQ